MSNEGTNERPKTHYFDKNISEYYSMSGLSIYSFGCQITDRIHELCP